MTTAREYSDVEYVFEPHSPVMPDLRKYVGALWQRRAFRTLRVLNWAFAGVVMYNAVLITHVLT